MRRPATTPPGKGLAALHRARSGPARAGPLGPGIGPGWGRALRVAPRQASAPRVAGDSRRTDLRAPDLWRSPGPGPPTVARPEKPESRDKRVRRARLLAVRALIAPCAYASRRALLCKRRCAARRGQRPGERGAPLLPMPRTAFTKTRVHSAHPPPLSTSMLSKELGPRGRLLDDGEAAVGVGGALLDNGVDDRCVGGVVVALPFNAWYRDAKRVLAHCITSCGFWARCRRSLRAAGLS